MIRRPGEMLELLRLLSPADHQELNGLDNENDISSRMGHISLGSRNQDSRGEFRSTNAHNVHDDHGFIDEEDFQREEVDLGIGDIIRRVHASHDPSEAVLLQDLPFTLQGINTSNFVWGKEQEEGKDTAEHTSLYLDLPSTSPWPMLGLLNQLVEPAMLYRYLSEFLEDRKSKQNTGLVKQSLNSAIQDELQSYMSIIGVIENHVRKQEFASRKNTGGITLRRCMALLQETTLGLRILYTIVLESKDLIGGQILSLLKRYTHNGDEFVSKFSQRLLIKLSKPFYEILNHWISIGSLVDPYSEFFILLGDHSSKWEGRFVLVDDKVPSYMTEKTTKEIFEIGKTLYFIRVVCKDNEWVDVRRTNLKPVEDYNDLENVITKSYWKVVEHLNIILKHDFHLDLHLLGLKDYLLLGKGDFVQVLVENAAPILDQPANRLLRHHLTSTLETAIRTSNAQYDDAEVLKCLDARMLELGHGDIGWDVFTLDYRVESPLDVVLLNQGDMTEYLRVFNFLWRIKRVSFSLYVGWRRMSTGHRTIIGDLYNSDWQFVRRVFQEMMHFINELQYYINFEVVEMAWAELERSLSGKKSTALTVDEIISAHRKYLNQITYKGLLGGGSLIGEFHGILKGMLAFRECIDGLYEITVRMRMQQEQNNNQVPQSMVEKFDSICSRIRDDLQVNFERSVEKLVHELGRQEDNEMKFLGVRLDFNRFYSSKRTA